MSPWRHRKRTILEQLGGRLERKCSHNAPHSPAQQTRPMGPEWSRAESLTTLCHVGHVGHAVLATVRARAKTRQEPSRQRGQCPIRATLSYIGQLLQEGDDRDAGEERRGEERRGEERR